MAQRTRRTGVRGTRGELALRPLTPERWDDFERLFGPRGACGGCWCMWHRLSHAEYERSKGAGNRRKMRALVARGRVPGLLAYVDGELAGWCSLEPRESFPRLARSRLLAPVDSERVWSLPCFFVAKAHRRKGLSKRILAAAAEYAASRGARIVEGYPVEPRRRAMSDAFAFWGIASAFESAGFEEVARRSPTRPIFRKRVVGARLPRRAAT